MPWTARPEMVAVVGKAEIISASPVVIRVWSSVTVESELSKLFKPGVF